MRPKKYQTMGSGDLKGRPGIEMRFVSGLFLPKHIYGLSDEAVRERWVCDPYFQYFTGKKRKWSVVPKSALAGADGFFLIHMSGSSTPMRRLQSPSQLTALLHKSNSSIHRS
jgi:hypothetical protein